MANEGMELVIYNIEDRLKVAEILIKNGYTVAQRKRLRTTGKSNEYYLLVIEDEQNAETVK